jgi:4-hydroxy-L-threonine phosphate dehydrogenase PdxA
MPHHPIPLSPNPSVSNYLPIIGITMGDPTGIGPEIIVKALSKRPLFQICRPVIFGDQGVLWKTIRRLGTHATVEVFREVPEEGYSARKIFLLPLSHLTAPSLRF